MSSTYVIRTILMFFALSVILMAIGGLIGEIFFNGMWLVFTTVMFAISLLMCFLSYFFSKEIALKGNHARIISEYENPRLYGIVKDLAMRANIPMPEVGIVISNQPNAFATGRNPKNSAVVATSAILELLPDDELRGVLAHEISHIKNRDILVMSVASALSTVICYLNTIATHIMIVTSDDGSERLVAIIVATVLRIFVPFAAFLVQLGISRSREYLADESGGRLINDPRALARALGRLENGIIASNGQAETDKRYNETQSYNPADNQNTAHMWIACPFSGKDSVISKLFSTHPPMEERIRRLNELANELGL